jgi:hypothetical protein
LLGVLDRGQTPLGLSSFLFAEPNLPSALPPDAALPLQEWRQLQESALAIRGKLTAILLEHSGCFQSDGNTAYGVDIARLLENVPADGEKPDLERLENIEPGITSALGKMSEASLGVRAKRVLTEAARLQEVLQKDLGDNFDKNQVVAALKDLVDGMGGTWSNEQMGMTSAAFKRLGDEFRESAVKEAQTTLQQAAVQLDGDKADGKGLSRIAQLDINPLIVAHRFVLMARKVVTVVKVRADSLHGATKEIDVEAEANRIRAAFDSLLGDIDVLEAEGEQECC